MSRPVPKTRPEAAPLADHSPLHADHARSAALTSALLGDLESEAERRSSLYVELNPKSNQACEALRNGDREKAARLFDELAQAWLDAGFAQDAASCASLAQSARNPVAPKTLSSGRRGRRWR